MSLLHRSLSVGSLFSGIGGWDLGLERTGGFRTSWFCEQDEFCRRILAKHWPNVPCHTDITELHHPAYVDVLCGGFPCQDLSYAGLGAGITGARSGLWTEYARLIGEIGPRYVLVENVSALLTRGLGVVLGDLAALGYDAEWDCIPASAVGAPHQRDRVWLVAYPNADRGRLTLCGERDGGQEEPEQPAPLRCDVDGLCSDVADADTLGRERPGRAWDGWSGLADRGGWPAEPAVGRVVDGFPGRVDRVKTLGNALVPQIAEWIGTRILAHEAEEAVAA